MHTAIAFLVESPPARGISLAAWMMRKSEEDAMRQDELQMRIAAWLLFTVSLTAAALETQRYYVTHLGTLRGTIGAARPMAPSTVDERRSIRKAEAGTPAPLPSGRRAQVDRRALTRSDGLLLVLLMAGGSRPILR